MTDTLHIFAVTAAPDLRHTHLTRATGEAPNLPPLTDWLGAEVDTDEIELFPVKDLGEMRLSEYVGMAFGPETIAARDARRMDALKGHVLLVPERALGEEPAPGREATLIASLLLAAPDHAASLPKADVTPVPRPEPGPTAPTPQRARKSQVWKFAAFILVFIILFILLDG